MSTITPGPRSTSTGRAPIFLERKLSRSSGLELRAPRRGPARRPNRLTWSCESLSPGAPATQTYDIRGTVVAVAPDSGTVNLDHEEIPGVMAAMKENGVPGAGCRDAGRPEAGDRVSGRLQARDGEYLILALEKQPRR